MYYLKINHINDFEFKVSTQETNFTIDAKRQNSLTPLDALLAGLGSCLGVYVRKYAETAKINLENFMITVKADLSGNPPICFQNIDVTLDLMGAQLDERRKGALLDFIKKCPAHNTLKGNPNIDIRLI